jgi:hypothetical protein
MPWLIRINEAKQKCAVLIKIDKIYDCGNVSLTEAQTQVLLHPAEVNLEHFLL